MKLVSLIGAGVLLVAIPLGHAEMLQGNVTLVNPEANIFKMEAKDPLTGDRKNFDIVVTHHTAFDGVDSILELKLGDDVSVEGQRAEDERTWRAISVDVPQSEITDQDLDPFAEAREDI